MFKLLLGMSYFFMIYGNKLVAFFLYEVLHADGDEELLNLVCEILPLQSAIANFVYYQRICLVYD
ncbi:hypothetical protein HanRHA438_Chr03g0114241 [Helianthus annuus]|nr:hypothetical protein HanHA300_Chr03g0086121 [Helianthus annuus]KAJ0600101.1 hypothetical protein HanIR_Chr03g0112721 [Helianthus annuus]KAJ0607520.1 hypothetical protein HanHA89_Chr03g0097671 [Helianthus annuus]KAJ0767584.1 hypothetical protein HanLR1_Chr03g0091031 [Helianthus annuus]KAJ0773405.1 hypothetical protein HanOQP8_Chr03g0098891 [Helianthus annuus]